MCLDFPRHVFSCFGIQGTLNACSCCAQPQFPKSCCHPGSQEWMHTCSGAQVPVCPSRVSGWLWGDLNFIP